jgi:oligosaccharide repeat unit polymerase
LQNSNFNSTEEVKLNVRPTLLLHPLILFSIVWLGVVFLYSLHLSSLLEYSTKEAIDATLFIWLPFAGLVAIFYPLRGLVTLAYPAKAEKTVLDIKLLERKLTLWFRIWIIISCLEIVVSGGLPIIWLFTHNPKTYFDFGITSLHGLVNSLLITISLCRFALFLITGKRKNLLIPAFVIFWSVIVISRNMMLVSLLEFAIVYLRLNKIRISTFIRLVGVLISFILSFGIIGDFRQGSADAIRRLAQPTAQYPEWLPSGVLWGYIYITTPINNLIYTMNSVHPENNLLFPNTVSYLFPTVIRTLVYGSTVDQAVSGNLVVTAFNVSTAYVGPFQDFGYIGMALFSIGAAFVCQLFWFRTALRDILIFSVLSQCLAITLFFNHFFALPIITQVVWLYYFFMKRSI